MDLNKSLDYCEIVATLLSDICSSLGGVYTQRNVRLDIQKISKRVSREGVCFLTKQLPRLGKALDRALTGEVSLDSTGFRKIAGTKIPILFGDLFKCVFTLDGWVLPYPCVQSIKSLRQILLCFAKLKLPNDQKLDNKAIEAFVQAEQDVREDVAYLEESYGSYVTTLDSTGFRHSFEGRIPFESRILLRARAYLSKVFSSLEVSELSPRHGPGTVSTKETGPEKWRFRRLNPRCQVLFPADKYYFVNLEHLISKLDQFNDLTECESFAQVILVPKDSRGPRVISSEPLENQWFQQGVRRLMIRQIESHPLTRNEVRFTYQDYNRSAALEGSRTGLLATLDLKEASDRVSMWLVQQLLPGHVLSALEAVRSLATVLPDGKIVRLHKHAPMGSATCFPVLACVVWAILRAGLDMCSIEPASNSRFLLVYGDDVIVSKAYAKIAISLLESFGLHVNRDKSCTTGFFRESCGMDAFAGVNVTPVRFRTVWSSSRAADSFVSWIAYANQLYRAGYRLTAQLVASRLRAIYGPLPEAKDKEETSYPCLLFETGETRLPQIRWNHNLQCYETRVYSVTSISRRPPQDGWEQLHRYFTEKAATAPLVYGLEVAADDWAFDSNVQPSAVYTDRRKVKLIRGWRIMETV